jgi:hypothetical protein
MTVLESRPVNPALQTCSQPQPIQTPPVAARFSIPPFYNDLATSSPSSRVAEISPATLTVAATPSISPAPHRRRGSNHLAAAFRADAVARLPRGGARGAGAGSAKDFLHISADPSRARPSWGRRSFSRRHHRRQQLSISVFVQVGWSLPHSVLLDILEMLPPHRRSSPRAWRGDLPQYRTSPLAG